MNSSGGPSPLTSYARVIPLTFTFAIKMHPPFLREFGKRRDHLGRRLHQLDQYPFAGDRKLLVRFRMQKTNVESGRALANAARREPYALPRQPIKRLRQIVDP